jgi:Cytochrome P450
MWLMEDAQGDDTAEKALSNRLLVVNFAAIHTSTVVRLPALTYASMLLLNIPSLRPSPMPSTIWLPIQSMLTLCATKCDLSFPRKAGQKEQLTRCIDSIASSKSHNAYGHWGTVRNYKRTQPAISAEPLVVLMDRVVMDDHTFSNGVTLPKGTKVAIDVSHMHMGPYYINAKEFDPWRFIKIQETTGKRNDMTTTSNEFLAFGHGRHVCPGRFFAAVKLKLMMAHLVTNYDVKCEQDGVRPKDTWIGHSCVPNANAKLLFRKRQGV